MKNREVTFGLSTIFHFRFRLILATFGIRFDNFLFTKVYQMHRYMSTQIDRTECTQLERRLWYQIECWFCYSLHYIDVFKRHTKVVHFSFSWVCDSNGMDFFAIASRPGFKRHNIENETVNTGHGTKVRLDEIVVLYLLLKKYGWSA